MDPEANYQHQQRIYHRAKAGEALPGDRAMLRELIAAMRGWVAAGGFKPRGYVGPAWKPAKAATGGGGGKPIRCAECGRKLDAPGSHMRPRTNRRCALPDYVDARTGKAIRKS